MTLGQAVAVAASVLVAVAVAVLILLLAAARHGGCPAGQHEILWEAGPPPVYACSGT